MVYLTFAIDVFDRRVVGWRDSRIHHSDRRPQYVSIRYTQHLAEVGIELSVGSVGDSCDCALAETMIGLFKTKVIHQLEP